MCLLNRTERRASVNSDRQILTPLRCSEEARSLPAVPDQVNIDAVGGAVVDRSVGVGALRLKFGEHRFDLLALLTAFECLVDGHAEAFAVVGHNRAAGTHIA